jgi:hypothetical protein
VPSAAVSEKFFKIVCACAACMRRDYHVSENKARGGSAFIFSTETMPAKRQARGCFARIFTNPGIT